MELKRVIVGIGGATGVVYGVKIVNMLLQKHYNVDLILTKTSEAIILEEIEDGMGWLEDLQRKPDHEFMALTTPSVIVHRPDNFHASISSGSVKTEGMIIAPCSMGCLARVAHGMSSNLMERAADVVLKEGRPLLIVPRETPFSRIHIENMLKLSKMGVVIHPALPSFYNNPESIDEMVDHSVGRILERFGIDNNLMKRWEGNDVSERSEGSKV